MTVIPLLRGTPAEGITCVGGVAGGGSLAQLDTESIVARSNSGAVVRKA
ncbi:hypothetical protein [Micromonospora sp. CPCC 205561]